MIFLMWSRELPRPSGPERQLGGPGDLLVGDHDRAGLEPVQALLDDPQRLAHLLQADQEAAVGVAAVGGRDVEVAHRSSPFISIVGRALSAASSASRAASSAFTPSLVPCIFLVELEDRVHQHLGPRRAAGEVDVDGDDVVDALDDGVVVEHAARGGAHAHGDHPLGVGHLVVDLPQHRGHLLADPPGDDHQIGLARGAAEDLHAEARQVVAPGTGGHHLDGTAGEAEGGGEDRRLAHPPGGLLDGGQQEAARQLFFESHELRPLSPIPGRRAATRRRRRRRR
ncbi:hypothetical protein SVIOM74S_05845 [Streptomyces violarus]